MAALIEFTTPQAEDTLVVNQLSPELFKLSLTRQNKSALFSDAIDRLESGHEETDLILRNLEAWAPSVAESFHRRTSDVILSTPFRLICSNPASDGSAPAGIPFDCRFVIRQFLAISYSWHNPSWPGTPNSAPEPGSIWPVGKRFADAIIALRGHPREGVWMDQICINQTDEEEKQYAIACMDVIYKSCRKLVVLLEDVELTEEEAEVPSFFEDLKNNPYWEQPRDKRDIPRFLSMFDKVSKARWWQRAWCFHEFVVGEPWSDKRFLDVHETVFVVGLEGNRTFTVDCLKLRVALGTIMTQLRHKTPSSRHIEPKLAGFENRTSPLYDSPERKAGSIKASFMARFNAVAQTDCSVPGDRLSICINLVGLGVAYFRSGEPTADDAYYMAVLLALAAGEKRPLAFVNLEPLMLNGSESWLQRSITGADTTLGKFTLGSVKGVHSVSTESIVLDLIFLETSWGGYNMEGLDATYDIFPDTIKDTPLPTKPDGLSADVYFRAEEEVQMPRRRFLAAVLAAGPGLVKRLWGQLERDVVRGSYNSRNYRDFAANNDLKPNADAFLKALYEKGDERVVITDETALLFITWITDPRSIYWVSWILSRIRCTRDGEEALLTNITTPRLPEMCREETKVYVAVPTDLLGEDCVLTKAWFLAPEEGEGRWRVLGKSLLLGEPDLLEELKRNAEDGVSDAAVSLRKRQTILGGIDTDRKL